VVDDLVANGFERVRLWSRGVDQDVFRPQPSQRLDSEPPIFLYVGRVAVEKNVEAFLELDLPGSKWVVGTGPALDRTRERFPKANYLGLLDREELAKVYAAADVFVFPSKTDTFGIVQLEALACGVPVAAYPVTGPRDVISGHPVGVLHDDLETACMEALQVSRAACRDFALTRSWDTSARQFLGHVNQILHRSRGAAVAPLAVEAMEHG
jgi:glycosyltransferase involved in cell wall biosynthesis